MLNHVKLRENVNYVSMPVEQRNKVLELTRQQFKAAVWVIPDDFMTYTHFKRCVSRVDLTSSPGYPYMRSYPSNKIFFSATEDGVIPDSRLEYVWSVVQTQINNRISDPIRTFIKQDPHKVSKIESERYRIISSVSIIDQLIDSMLFGECNDEITRNWPLLPSKVGWTPLKGGHRHIPKKGMSASDKSAWDWVAPPWALELCYTIRESLCLNINDLWKDLASWRYKELFYNPIFILSNGLLLKQLVPGIMKSGCFNTITDNSIMQVLLHIRVCLELGIPIGVILAMGDDVLQQLIDRLQEYYDRLGQYCVLKATSEFSEFAGFLFDEKSVEPMYTSKHCYNILHMDPLLEPDIADSYSLLYHRSKYRSWFRTLFEKMGHELPSISYLDAIWDGTDYGERIRRRN